MKFKIEIETKHVYYYLVDRFALLPSLSSSFYCSFLFSDLFVIIVVCVCVCVCVAKSHTLFFSFFLSLYCCTQTLPSSRPLIPGPH
jgi:hypothetical protein